jgi:plastocyanin
MRLLVCSAIALVAVGWPAAFAATKTVELRGRAFDDKVVSIKVGDAVGWIHRDGNRDHSVTASAESRAQGVSFDSHPNCRSGLFRQCMGNGDTFRFVFDTRGTFTYFCKIHGRDAPYPGCGMCGQVRVSAASTSRPPTVPPTGTGTGTGSPSTSASPSPSDTPSESPTNGQAAGPPTDGDEPGGAIAIAAGAVALLTGSGFLVYRTLIRRSA